MLRGIILISLCIVFVSACALTETSDLEVETQTGMNSDADGRSRTVINDLASAAPPDGGSSPAMEVNKALSAEYVRRIQAHLKTSGFYSGSVDGVVGPKTQSAIQRFQSGCLTLRDVILNSDTEAFEPNSAALAIRASAAKNKNVGGETIRILQLRLKDAGFDPGPVDGIHGARTRTALFALKSGCVMLQDFPKIAENYFSRMDNVAAVTVTPVSALTERSSSTGLQDVVAGTVDKNSSRDAIRALQARLREAGFDPGPVDGILGPKTKLALRSYQASRR